MNTEIQETLLTFKNLSKRWDGYSVDSLRRLESKGDLRTVNIGGRKFVPMAEIQRAERFGVGKGRKSRAVKK